MGFEPTGVSPPAVFKTAAINQTLPTLLVGETGFEPATLCSQSRRSKSRLSYSPICWRSERDLNPRMLLHITALAVRRHKPLGHPTVLNRVA